jgi:hypothetical protein
MHCSIGLIVGIFISISAFASEITAQMKLDDFPVIVKYTNFGTTYRQSLKEIEYRSFNVVIWSGRTFYIDRDNREVPGRKEIRVLCTDEFLDQRCNKFRFVIIDYMISDDDAATTMVDFSVLRNSHYSPLTQESLQNIFVKSINKLRTFGVDTSDLNFKDQFFEDTDRVFPNIANFFGYSFYDSTKNLIEDKEIREEFASYVAIAGTMALIVPGFAYIVLNIPAVVYRTYRDKSKMHVLGKKIADSLDFAREQTENLVYHEVHLKELMRIKRSLDTL